MRILYCSSTEYGGFIEGLLRELNAEGFSARQYYQVSESGYRSAKSRCARLWLRVRQYIVYPMQLVLTLLAEKLTGRGKDSIVVMTTNTFFAPLLATYLHGRVVHLVYDLFPEALIHSAKWQEGTAKVRIVRWITRLTLRRAHANVFLGARLRAYVESVYGETPNSTIIAVGADQTLFPTKPSSRQMDKDAPMILYCGNFGNMHEANTLFNYWRSIGGESLPLVDWSFYCSGPKRQDLEGTVTQLPASLAERIQLGVGLKQDAWIEIMGRADIALVTMVPGSERVVVPSKTYSAMMAGQAILAIAPKDSDLVDMLKEADAGWCVEPGDVDALARVIREIASDPDQLLRKRENAYRYAHDNLGQDSLAKQWKEVLKSI